MSYESTLYLLDQCGVTLRLIGDELRASPHENITPKLRQGLRQHRQAFIESLRPKRRRLPLGSVVWAGGEMAILERYFRGARVGVKTAKAARFKIYSINEVDLIFEPN